MRSTPKVMTEGNWKLGVYVDAGASDEKFDKLVAIFSGQLGGPMAGLAPLIGEMRGVERAAIEIGDDGLTHTVRVGDSIDFEIQDIVRSASRAASRFAPTACSIPSDRTLTMAEAKRTRINAFGITYEGMTGLSKSESPRLPRSMSRPERLQLPAAAGLAPLYAAVRARLLLVAALFAAAVIGWVWTAREMRGMDNGPWTDLGGFTCFVGVWSS